MSECYIFKYKRKHAVNEYTGKCIGCKEKVQKSEKERTKETVDALPLEKKQRFLDLLHKGKTIGEAKDDIGVNLYEAMEIMDQNIGNYSFLRTEANRGIVRNVVQ